MQSKTSVDSRKEVAKIEAFLKNMEKQKHAYST